MPVLYSFIDKFVKTLFSLCPLQGIMNCMCQGRSPGKACVLERSTSFATSFIPLKNFKMNYLSKQLLSEVRTAHVFFNYSWLFSSGEAHGEFLEERVKVLFLQDTTEQTEEKCLCFLVCQQWLKITMSWYLCHRSLLRYSAPYIWETPASPSGSWNVLDWQFWMLKVFLSCNLHFNRLDKTPSSIITVLVMRREMYWEDRRINYPSTEIRHMWEGRVPVGRLHVRLHLWTELATLDISLSSSCSFHFPEKNSVMLQVPLCREVSQPAFTKQLHAERPEHNNFF